MPNPDIKTAWLNEEHWKRGPGGNWFKYEAWCYDAPSLFGYGCTAREAVNDLKSKLGGQS